MRKSLKLLVLLLAISIIGTMLVFAASAETTTGGIENATRITSTSGTVTCESDVKITTADLKIANGKTLTIDLQSKYTLYIDARIMVGNSAAANLVIKDGNVVMSHSGESTTGGRIQTRAGATVTLENVNLTTGTYTVQNPLIQDYGATFVFNNTVFTIKSDYTGRIFYLPAQANVAYSYVFNNTKFINESSTAYWLKSENTTSASAPINIYLMNGSALTNAQTSNYIYIKSGATVPVFHIEEGTKLDTNTVGTKISPYTTFYKEIEYADSTVTLGDSFTAPEAFGLSGDEAYPYMVSENVYNAIWNYDGTTETELYAEGAVPSREVSFGGVAVGEDGKLYSNKAEGWSYTEGADTSDTLTGITTDTNYYAVTTSALAAWGEFDKDKNVLSYSVNTNITLAEIRGFSKDSTIVFYDNITYTGAAHISGYSANLTFDLGGNSFDKGNYRFVLEGDDVTFKNGTVKTSGEVGFFGPNKTATLTLDGVTVEYDTSSAISLKSGYVVIKNESVIKSTATSANVAALYLDENDASGVLSLTVENSDVLADDSDTAISLFGRNVNKVFETSISVTGAKVEAGKLFATAAGRKLGTESTATLTVKDSIITVSSDGYILNVEEDVSLKSLDVSFESSEINMAPVLGFGKLTYANGQSLVKMTDGNYFVKTVGYSMKTNLSLFSDFNVNFYIPTNTAITSVVLGETVYNISELKETVKISDENYYRIDTPSVAAYSAADGITVKVVYAEGETEYTHEAVYSVIKYASSLLADTNDEYSTDSKVLMAQAVKYIESAYNYAEIDIPSVLSILLESDIYKSRVPSASELPTTTTDKGNIETAVTGAQLDLASKLKYRLNLNSSYSGTLSVNGENYTVVNGVCNDNTYIEINMRAYEMFDTVLIIQDTDKGISGSYDLAAYISNTKATYGADEKLLTLLDNLYTYTAQAKSYRTAHPDLD